MLHPPWCDRQRCTASKLAGNHKGLVHTVEDGSGRELLRWFLQAPNGARPGVLLAASPAGPLDDAAVARFVEGVEALTLELRRAGELT
jgi:predicted ABC-type transport system involved in lysophospholipase L1 biosynthesis ATPase subunit